MKTAPFLVVLVGAASVAAAQPAIDSRLRDRLERQRVTNEKNAVLTAHEIARCVIERRERQTREFLASVDPDQSRALFRRLGAELDCFALTETSERVEATAVAFPRDIARGMFAEQLIKKNMATFAVLAPLARVASYSRSWYAVSGRASTVDEMGTCAAETAPASIVTLIRTQPYSDGEGAAFAALSPTLGACLVAGAKLDANRQALRAALADALYQRIANPVASPPTQTAPMKQDRGA